MIIKKASANLTRLTQIWSNRSFLRLSKNSSNNCLRGFHRFRMASWSKSRILIAWNSSRKFWKVARNISASVIRFRKWIILVEIVWNRINLKRKNCFLTRKFKKADLLPWLRDRNFTNNSLNHLIPTVSKWSRQLTSVPNKSRGSWSSNQTNRILMNNWLKSSTNVLISIWLSQLTPLHL